MGGAGLAVAAGKQPVGYEPRRSTLHGLLTDMADKEGLLEIVKRGAGRKPSRYRKLSAAASDPATEPGQ